MDDEFTLSFATTQSHIFNIGVYIAFVIVLSRVFWKRFAGFTLLSSIAFSIRSFLWWLLPHAFHYQLQRPVIAVWLPPLLNRSIALNGYTSKNSFPNPILQKQHLRYVGVEVKIWLPLNVTMVPVVTTKRRRRKTYGKHLRYTLGCHTQFTQSTIVTLQPLFQKQKRTYLNTYRLYDQGSKIEPLSERSNLGKLGYTSSYQLGMTMLARKLTLTLNCRYKIVLWVLR